MSQKNSYVIGAVVILLILVGLMFNKSKKDSGRQDSERQSQESINNPDELKGVIPQKENLANQDSDTKNWVGTLKNSDNLNKGNLMLVTKERTIYLRTSRDWKKLINTEVRVAYDGNLESFTLIDIWPITPTNN